MSCCATTRQGEGSTVSIVAVIRLGALLLSAGAVRPQAPAEPTTEDRPLSADEGHANLFSENRFPASTTCPTCRPQQYREWSVSPHTYTQMSPVFNAFHGAVLVLANGINGDFCIRCCSPPGMNLEEPGFMSNMDRHHTSRQGVTCIVCHRQNRSGGKVGQRLALTLTSSRSRCRTV